MRSNYSAIVFFSVTLLICWMNYQFYTSSFSVYRRRLCRYGYWITTIATCVIIGYMLPVRFMAVNEPGMLFGIYGALVWLIGQVFMLLVIPFVYIFNKIVKAGLTTLNVNEESEQSSSKITRRVFLQQTLAVTPLFSLGIGVQGIYDADASLVSRSFNLHTPELPPNLNGFRIVQISDTHIGPYFTLEKLSRAIKQIQAETPDLLVITGDMIDDPDLLTPALHMLGELHRQIPHGIYFCWGNHEYRHNIGRVRQELMKSPINLLQNNSSLVVPGPKPFYLIGVDFPWAKTSNEREEKRRRFMKAATKDVPPDAFTILLAHHSDFLFDGFAAKIPLTLAGHTHGGQVVVLGHSVLPLPYTYMRGLYKDDQAYGYVNSGAGHWFPFRLGCPPEISVFNLYNTI